VPGAATAEPARTAKPENTGGTTASGRDYSYLDTLPPDEDADNEEAGRRVAEAYGRRGYGVGGLRTRRRNPPNIRPVEMPAVATLRYLMNAEAMYFKHHQRYGSLPELHSAGAAALEQAPSGNTFQRAGYRFELTPKGDEFEIVAMPLRPGPRAFKGSDAGSISEGID